MTILCLKVNTSHPPLRFMCLPVCAVIEEKIICMHGGISPDLKNLGQILNIPRPTDIPDQGITLRIEIQIKIQS